MNDDKTGSSAFPATSPSPIPTRRGFLLAGAAASGIAVATAITSTAAAQNIPSGPGGGRPGGGGGPGGPGGGGPGGPGGGGGNQGTAAARARQAYRVRADAATAHRAAALAQPPQQTNGDETRYAGEHFASYSKSLPSNSFGEVESGAFEQLQEAMRTGNSQDFNAIGLDPTANRPLTNPQGAFKFEMMGLDSHATRIAPSHTFRSAELAGEIAEVYWQALTRDIPYSAYSNNADIAAAITDLNALSAPPGVAANGSITPQTLFRGETTGDLVGPYISQYLWNDFSFGPVDIEQRYREPIAETNFMVSESDWLNVQRGGAPLEQVNYKSVKRYIHNNRSLGEYVHKDVSFQAYLHAAMQLLALGPTALAEENPYRSSMPNQDPFVSLGGPFVLDVVTKAGNLGLSGAWFQKWRQHRFLRPEALGGRIHFHLTGQRSYELHPDILASNAVQRVFTASGTHFLPQAFTEGSPTHPSYPAGHAMIAGACVTILKALFDENFVLPNPVVANASGTQLLPFNGSDLSLGNELNKLANNIAIGRNAAGVHYRQDGIQGLLAGQQMALALLQDQARTLHEEGFQRFSLTTFEGARVEVQASGLNFL